MQMSRYESEFIRGRLREISPEERTPPDISVVIPVNAKGDLENVLDVIGDIARYTGTNTIEILCVINNFPQEEPPPAMDMLRSLGIRTLAIPDARKPGEAVGFSARIPGVEAARSELVVLFDADCRIPDSTSLLDWYFKVLTGGAQGAYTYVGYYDYADHLSVRFRFAIHHLARWFKRFVLRVPTTRGSNYAVRRSTMLQLYGAGMLADEMNVGPTVQRLKGKVVYGAANSLRVYTSGRMFRPGWRRIFPYFLYRLRYNLRVLPVRSGVAAVTGRENDPVREYVANRPVRRSR